MMRSNLANRLAKLEPKPRSILIPTVVQVGRDETTGEALSRFHARFAGKLPPRHAMLVVPRRDSTAEDDADFAVKFAVQQTKLVADVRSIRLKDVQC